MTTTPEEVTSYQEGVKELEDEEKKEQPRKKRLRKLMKATFIGRRDWMVKDAPPVSTIMEAFPPLKHPNHLLKEFGRIVDGQLDAAE